jgi:hypothetical protein
VALCAAAFALIATLRLVGRGASGRRKLPVWGLALAQLIPGESPALALRNSAAWLQRFLN